MKMRDVRAMIEHVAAVHCRLNSKESAATLMEFTEAIKPWDDKTVAAFVKVLGDGSRKGR